MALDLSPKTLVGPKGRCQAEPHKWRRNQYPGNVFYIFGTLLLVLTFFTKQKMCLFLLLLENISNVYFPPKKALNLQVNDCFNIHPEAGLWLSEKRAEVLASGADRGKKGGDHQGDNNRCVHVIGHLVHDPEVHGHKSVRTRLDLKMNVNKHEQIDYSFVIIFC